MRQICYSGYQTPAYVRGTVCSFIFPTDACWESKITPVQSNSVMKDHETEARLQQFTLVLVSRNWQFSTKLCWVYKMRRGENKPSDDEESVQSHALREERKVKRGV